MVWLLVLAGCEVVPRHVESEIEVDTFLAKQAYASVCVALKERDQPGLRTYAASQLVKYPSERDANQCLCAAIYDAEKHVVDAAVAKGVAKSRRTDLAECLIPALKDPLVEDRPFVVGLLADLDAEAGYRALEELTASGEDAPIREAATRGLLHATGAEMRLTELVLEDESAGVRKAAAEALADRRNPKVVDTIRQVLKTEKETEVRAAALHALVTSDSDGALETVCDILMEDDDAVMRIGAAKALQKTKERRAVDCLKKRLLEEELNPAVRTEVMESLASSPTERAKNALCSLIAPVMKLYVKDVIAEETPGVDIIKYQNNVDWERSFECVERAINTPGLSCYARNHLGKWMTDLGKKTHRPQCPGMKRLP